MRWFQTKSSWLALVALGAGACVALATVVAGAIANKSAGEFTRDVRTLCEQAGATLPFYAGVVSQLNIIVWASAGAFALLAACLTPARRGWLALFGAFLYLLAADDAFELHESGPHRFIPEPAFYAVYAAIAVVLLFGVSKHRGDESTLVFLVGGALLAVSVMIDQTVEHQYIWEDTAKLLGALLWLVVPIMMLIEEQVLVVGRRSATRPRQRS